MFKISHDMSNNIKIDIMLSYESNCSIYLYFINHNSKV